MKKLVALLLTFCMLFTMSTGAFAINLSSDVVKKAEGTYRFSSENYNSDIWSMTVYIPNEGDMVDITMKPQKEEKIYSAKLPKSAIKNLTVNRVFLEANKNNCEIEVHNISEYIMEVDYYSSQVQDLIAELRAKHGKEYSGKVLATYDKSDFPKVSRIQIKEDLFYRNSTSYYYFPAKTAISAIAYALTGKSNSEIIDKLETILDVVGTIQKEIRGDLYHLVVNYGRYGYINGGSHIYNDTYKLVSYTGLNPEDDEGRAEIIDKNDPTIRYGHSASYFNSYKEQAKDAYNAYLS